MHTIYECGGIDLTFCSSPWIAPAIGLHGNIMIDGWRLATVRNNRNAK